VLVVLDQQRHPVQQELEELPELALGCRIRNIDSPL